MGHAGMGRDADHYDDLRGADDDAGAPSMTRDTDGSPKGRDAQRLDGVAATAGAGTASPGYGPITPQQTDREAADAWVSGLPIGLRTTLAHPHKLYAAFAHHAQQASLEERDRREEEIDRLTTALHQIVQWAEAYPLKIFPEPDFVVCAAALKRAGQTLDAVSASNMRHVVEGVGKIARDAIRKGESA